MMSVSRAAPADSRSEVVTFTQYTQLASNLGMAERLLTPLTAAQIPARMAASGKGLRDQPINLEEEQFRIYVPQVAPPAGYGVLVFIPSWEDNHLPLGWASVLETSGIIFVSATKSGNDASPVGRREPLALLAAFNIIQRYPVNPARVYISGFSGGSRVALRLALGYPDLFRGALLDAGADPIGEPDLPFPPRTLFDQFRASSRIVYVTGSRDEEHREQESRSVGSMKRWCVENVSTQIAMGLGHEVASAPVLSEALAALDKTPRAPASRNAQCWTHVTEVVDAELAKVEQAIARSDWHTAESLLPSIDRRFGGLAAPRSTALAKQTADRADRR
jgi:pimeloyl-ACP methyl ester carboxylesterase